MTQKDKLPTDFWDDADVAHPSDVNTFTVSMNADQLRMYVAAPELLEALENLLKVHEGEGPSRYHAGDIARAAIAKAKGEAG